MLTLMNICHTVSHPSFTKRSGFVLSEVELPSTEQNRRYLAYLSALALSVAPVATVSAPAQAAGTETSVSASVGDSLAATPEKLAKMAAMSGSIFTECMADWAQCQPR
jgi:hypothetical protein